MICYRNLLNVDFRVNWEGKVKNSGDQVGGGSIVIELLLYTYEYSIVFQ